MVLTIYLGLAGKSSKSSNVFNALSWSWSSRSLQSPKDLEELHGSGDTCKPGAHCRTLDKLHSEEQTLYEKIKVFHID